MKSVRVAKRYAKALYQLAEERNELDIVRNDMELIQQICKECKDFAKVLQSPVINTAKKLSIFKSIFQNNISSFSFHFLNIVAKKRRELIIGEISQEFLNLYNEHHNIKTVLFRTAVKCDDKLILELKQKLAQQLQAEIIMNTEVKEDLLGGFILKVDDKQFDASIRRNINRLKKEYNINVYVPKF